MFAFTDYGEDHHEAEGVSTRIQVTHDAPHRLHSLLQDIKRLSISLEAGWPLNVERKLNKQTALAQNPDMASPFEAQGYLKYKKTPPPVEPYISPMPRDLW